MQLGLCYFNLQLLSEAKETLNEALESLTKYYGSQHLEIGICQSL